MRVPYCATSVSNVVHTQLRAGESSVVTTCCRTAYVEKRMMPATPSDQCV
jgi:hypothetical protein